MKTTLNCLYYLIRRRTEWGECAAHLHPISFLGSTLFSWHAGHLDLGRLSWQSCGLKGLKQTQAETEPWRQKVCPGRTNKFSWTKSSWPKFCLLWTYSYGSMDFFFFQTTIWQRKCVKLSFGNSWKLDVIFFVCSALLLVGTCAVHHEKPNGAPVSSIFSGLVHENRPLCWESWLN